MGMGASGFLLDGWTAFTYSSLITWKAGNLGMNYGDFFNFMEWKGGFFSAFNWWANPKF